MEDPETDSDDESEDEAVNEIEEENEFLCAPKKFGQQNKWGSSMSLGTAASSDDDEDTFTSNLEQLFDGEHL